MNKKQEHTLAGIEYHGTPGISRDCLHAVMRLIQYGDTITHVRILSASSSHSLLLTINGEDLVAIKSGFSSGYMGEGPRTFSYVLQLLDAHGAEIDEYQITSDFLERLDDSSLTSSDIESLSSVHPVRPSRWYDYISVKHKEMKSEGTLWQEFHPVIPFKIIDGRIFDLAISFWDNPDEKLLIGYRRLEDIVRKRTSIDDHSTRLFSQAFNGTSAKLGWKGLDGGEQAGRSQLFSAVFLSHRNPRAHREVQSNSSDELAEFLLLNYLFYLEKNAIELNDKS